MDLLQGSGFDDGFEDDNGASSRFGAPHRLNIPPIWIINNIANIARANVAGGQINLNVNACNGRREI